MTSPSGRWMIAPVAFADITVGMYFAEDGDNWGEIVEITGAGDSRRDPAPTIWVDYGDYLRRFKVSQKSTDWTRSGYQICWQNGS